MVHFSAFLRKAIKKGPICEEFFLKISQKSRGVATKPPPPPPLQKWGQ